jgi:hypothetical protein
MTQRTDTVTVGEANRVAFEEPYWQYSFDVDAVQARTDTPDLIGFFRRVQRDALMAEGYRESWDEDLEIAEADMTVGFETLADE